MLVWCNCIKGMAKVHRLEVKIGKVVAKKKKTAKFSWTSITSQRKQINKIHVSL